MAGSPPPALAALLFAVALLCWPGPSGGHRLRALGPRLPARVGGLRTTPVLSGSPALLAVVAVAVVGAAVLAGPGAAAAVAAVFGLGLHRWRGARRRRRDGAQLAALLDAVGLLVADLRAGAHPAAAAGSAAAAGDYEVHRVLAAVAAGAGLGAPVPRLLVKYAASGSTIAEGLERLAAVWALAETHGVALAELVEAVRADLEARQRMTTELHAQLAGPRATALVLAGLPILGVLLGESVGAGPLRVLTGPGVGQVLMVVGTALACTGVMWSERIMAGAVRT